MKKLYLLIVLLLLVGCSTKTKEETEKYTYLEYKNNLEEKEEFNNEEELDFDISFDVKEREEEINDYTLLINNPKSNMYNIKALLIHDAQSDEAYPTVGIFDTPISLLVGNDNQIILKGSLTTKQIEEVKFKLYLEYTTDDGIESKIYYMFQK